MKKTTIILFLIIVLGTFNTQGITTDQIVHLPEVGVHKITVLTEKPEDGIPIDAVITVQNNDSIEYTDLKLSVSITEMALGPHGKPGEPISVANKTISRIEANSKQNVSIQFTAEYGEYSLTAYILLNDTMIPNSMKSTVLQVISKPIGDIPTLVYSLGSIVLALIVVLLLPSIVDRFRRYKHKNGN